MTRFLPQLLLFSTVILFSACSSLSVAFDYDQQVDFSKYRSYQWQDGIGISWNKDGSTLSYDKNIVHTAVNSLLSRKGYIILISGEPDFFIVPHVNAKDIIRVSQWGYQYGPDWAPSTQVIDAAFYDGNNLFLDIVDARSRTLIWRGVATEMNPANLTPEVVTETVRKAASEMFKKFPPEQ
jgi:hypothetical protein